MITRLHLKNFKNFRDATLELGPLTVLVGTNASGKSNLRDAFRFIHGMSRGYNLAEIIGEKYGEGGVLQWKGIRGGTREVAYHGEGSFEIETELQLPSEVDDEQHRDAFIVRLTHSINVRLSAQVERPRVIREELLESDSVSYSSHLIKNTVNREETEYLVTCLPYDQEDRGVGSQPRFQSSQPVLSQLSTDRELALPYRMPAQLLRGELESIRFLDLSPEAMRQPSFPGQVILGDRGENLSSVIQAICEDEEMKHALAEWINEY